MKIDSISIGHIGFIMFLLGAILLSSCKNDQDVTVRLTSRERTQIDTLYSEQIKMLRPQWDSLCESRHDSLVVYSVDSIVRVREIEEAKIRARILEQQRQQQAGSGSDS